MQALKIVPVLHTFDTLKQFIDEFGVSKDDLLVTFGFGYSDFVKAYGGDIDHIIVEEYGLGEPSDEMIDKITAVMKSLGDHKRIIAMGGGSVIDVSKILILDVPEKSVDLFTGAVPPVKKRELIVIPTTVGTGSEVTNVSIAELKSLHIKKGLAVDETYADAAVLIPEVVANLPYGVFATSAIDALIHAVESYLSPKASEFTRLFSVKAINLITKGFLDVVDSGPDARKAHMGDFLLASNYAGIAFGNAGCAAVHALSYSIGGAFHVPHGEANYQFFTAVLKLYNKKSPYGDIEALKAIFAKILGVPAYKAIDELDDVLGKIIAKKPLKDYGMTEDQIDSFTASTVENQQRLLANNYVPLSDEELRGIFAELY
ncbi:MAG: 4-hydroxybutyrate dehydrogenase [Clostridiales Family XIII bacterium]|jgi:4-hydroxybutyrate dehydrogenase|nr:4-hydroxybutyrate dehydrogenase [Clostridiales Family XIII bacterium]